MADRFEALYLGSIFNKKKTPPCCPLVVFKDTESITVTGLGTEIDPFLVNAVISPDGGNVLVLHSNGLFIAEGGGISLTTVGSSGPAILAGGVLNIPTYIANVIVSSATTLTLATTARTYVYKGSVAATWTMPSVSGNINKEYVIKNAGTGTLTLIAAGSDHFYDTSAIPSITLLPGDAYIISNDGTFWNLI